MASSSNSDQHEAEICFHEWMASQEKSLKHLIETLTQGSDTISPEKEMMLKEEVERSVRDFEEYKIKRNLLSRRDVSNYLAPTWNTCLENSLMWIGACRPSSFIRLVYALWGSEAEYQVPDLNLVSTAGSEDEQGSIRGNVSFGDLTPDQLLMVNDLHMKTVREEDRLTTRLAIVQEDAADFPIAIIGDGGSYENVERALDEQETAMMSVLEEADNLRMSTLLDLLEILNPQQSAVFLAADKKLRLSIHEFGKKRDAMHGRNYQVP